MIELKAATTFFYSCDERRFEASTVGDVLGNTSIEIITHVNDENDASCLEMTKNICSPLQCFLINLTAEILIVNKVSVTNVNLNMLILSSYNGKLEASRQNQIHLSIDSS